MNIPADGEASYQYWIKTLDLETHTAADFQNNLTEAGFIDANIEPGKKPYVRQR
jgi:hypothetical protein